MPDFRLTVAPWRRLDSADAVSNHWLTLRREVCARPDGGVVDDYFVVAEPDVACAVALTANGQIVLVEQYKHGIGRVCLEIPGGAFDAADVDPLAVAQRELREETGYAGSQWHKLGVLAISPTRTTVQMHLFLALDCLQTSGQSLDPNEEIIVHVRPFAEALQMARSGVISATTSVAGLLLAAAELRERGLLE